MINAGQYLFKDGFEVFVKRAQTALVMTALEDEHNVYLDETNMVASKRSRFINDIRGNFDNVIINAYILPKLPKDQAIDNRLKDKRRHYSKETWAEVYNDFDAIYEAPTLTEGFNKIFTDVWELFADLKHYFSEQGSPHNHG